MSLFTPCPATGPFAPCGDDGTWVSLTFFRLTESQNSAGEIVLSFASHLDASVNLQPADRTLRRDAHGVLPAIDYTGMVWGNADIAERDRTVVSDAVIEVVNAQHWGTVYTDLELMHVR